eukprot:RCo002636
MPQFVDLRLVEEKHGAAKDLPGKSGHLCAFRDESLNISHEDELHLRYGGSLDPEYVKQHPGDVVSKLPTLAEFQQELKTKRMKTVEHGSCAGAGSQDFGKYMRARAWERKRVERLYQTEAQRSAQEEFEKRMQERKQAQEEKTKKKAQKRKKKKQREQERKAAGKLQKTAPGTSASSPGNDVSDSENSGESTDEGVPENPPAPKDSEGSSGGVGRSSEESSP